MSFGYIIASLGITALFVTAYLASVNGWGLASDSTARAQAAAARGGSVRTGSTHIRTYYGGGPGFGK
jgi:hypothetical protein